VIIETERLRLRPFAATDAYDLHEYLSQESVAEFEPYKVFGESESRAEAVKRSQNPSFWAVCLKNNSKLIGNVYLNPQEFDTWEIGFVFNERYRGQGYATEAAEALLKWAFTTQNARRVIAMCNPLNKSSWRLLERLGFRREGHLIQNIYFKHDAAGNPIWQDTYEYGLLATEFQVPYSRRSSF